MARNITHIVLHCTATVEGRHHTIADVARWHQQRGWRSVGYHYLVQLDGTVEAGRPEHIAGAHVAGHNSTTIGVAYVGGLGRDTKPKDTRTPKQKAALLKLLRELRGRYPKSVIVGHRDFSKDLNRDGVISPNEWMKACPSFDAKGEYKTL
jgi:N-acetyl-anhydromuramyl-L-alanine amidase AmpD